MTTQPSLLIYLHGFNSSPLSHKATVMKQYCEAFRPDIEVMIPQLPSYPNEIAETIQHVLSRYSATHRIGLVGSSLGGYFAAWANAQFGLRAVLVNPVVKPYELLTHFLGEQVNPYTHERYELTKQHIVDLRKLEVNTIPMVDSMWIMLQTGDEVLDYRQAVTQFAECKQTVENGGDHSFTEFERYAADVIEFLQL